MKANRSCLRRGFAGSPNLNEFSPVGPPLSDPIPEDRPMNDAPADVTSTTPCPRRRGSALRNTSQLDLGIAVSPGPVRRRTGPPPGSRARAQWWFCQMRQIVAEGRDFDAAGVI
ncbi:MAG: hypothetical protein U1G08_00645 [Verrucomicrobiota bacterium]